MLDILDYCNDNQVSGQHMAFKLTEQKELKVTGFIKPTDDFMENRLVLSHFLQDKPSTFFALLKGNSLNNAGIYDGDIGFIDKALTPKNGDIIFAVIESQIVCRRYLKKAGQVYLSTDEKENIPVTEFSDANLWGVVVSTIRRHRKTNLTDK